MGVKDPNSPPSEWCGWWDDIRQLTPTIAYGWPTNDPGPNPWFWHWCPATAGGRWAGQSTDNHQLVSRDPLHLEPSLLWPCCGTHGFVRNGEWVST